MKGCSSHRCSILLLMIFFLTLSGTRMLKVVDASGGCMPLSRFRLPNCQQASCEDLCRGHGYDAGYCEDVKDSCCCLVARGVVKKKSSHAHASADGRP